MAESPNGADRIGKVEGLTFMMNSLLGGLHISATEFRIRFNSPLRIMFQNGEAKGLEFFMAPQIRS